MTKKLKVKKNIFWLLSLILNVGPAMFYLCKGFSIATDKQRVVLSLMAITSIILCSINVVFKNHLRSPLWILVLGIYVCLQNIQDLLILMAICTVIDEFVITPLLKKAREKYVINVELDKRIN